MQRLFPLQRRWPEAAMAVAASSVQGRRKGNGLLLGPMTEWAGSAAGPVWPKARREFLFELK
jgi:hypothetical protein